MPVSVVIRGNNHRWLEQETHLSPTKCAEARAFVGTDTHIMHVLNVY